MPDYQAPIEDIRFTLRHIAGLEAIAQLPGYQEASLETCDAILGEAARFAAEVLAPLNRIGDMEGAKLAEGKVRVPAGQAEAYRQFAEAGWNSVAFDPDFGGQGMPWALTTALQEIWNAANMAFSLCPLLTQGAVEALQIHGSDAQKKTYLAPLIAGRWTGTMNLTEPQAGSDLGALKTRAEPKGDHHLLTGQKIFITYGDHEMAENIVHFVLARLPDAPKGSKGISLFIVPKFLVNQDGSLGARNDVKAVALEHKLGIHASPTCVMAYGDEGGAVGYLVGEPNRGLEYMFTMMNNARLAVGVQGLAIAERALQAARAYASERVQGTTPGNDPTARLPIHHHPDIRRSLMALRAWSEATRCLIYFAAGTLDRAKRHPDSADRAGYQALVDLLIPIAKAWSTDRGVAAASLGLQIHGGAGFIEETGVAQFYRDARIAPIYEGTNGIQAIDLLGRKLLRDGGRSARGLIASMTVTLEALKVDSDLEMQVLSTHLEPTLTALSRATEHLLKLGEQEIGSALAGASPYLELFGLVLGGWLLAKSTLAARQSRDPILDEKLAVTQFYMTNQLPQALGLEIAIVSGAESVLKLAPERI
ncbi:acyl-CoA dehydrogenase [Dongia soli]|uniref:Acyl-CoA dehydrogenase n=1 Tax=Dongia soli TaxID=600628 RepID=A0ABU5ECX4_9PROT|nr:acyl-CoA dehydrogenase [Dongia soli]MDY0884233.1 acyl-CoA dehydrogenase [Dongia soli]